VHTLIEVEPQPRFDTLVGLPTGVQARRTDYSGTAWLDGKPELAGPMLRRPGHAPKGIRVPTFQVAFFLPDSLPYQGAALADATLSISVALQASGDTGAIVGAAAIFTDDPSGAPTWIQVQLNGSIGWPTGVAYRVVALTSVDAVR
jgi:hypothetical protein